MSKKRYTRYEHRFDWDEAKRLHEEENIPIAWIAAKYRVTPGAIARIVNPGAREAGAEYSRAASIGQGRCEDCGKPTNKYSSYRRADKRSLCKACASRRTRTTVREDSIRCTRCNTWKPDSEFQNSNMPKDKIRRGKRSVCRECSTAIRTAFRHAHRTPCLGGCGRTVSVTDQRAQIKRRQAQGKQTNVTLGYCPYCPPTGPYKDNKIKSAAARFREKFGTPSDKMGTTEN